MSNTSPRAGLRFLQIMRKGSPVHTGKRGGSYSVILLQASGEGRSPRPFITPDNRRKHSTTKGGLEEPQSAVVGSSETLSGFLLIEKSRKVETQEVD